MSVFEDEDFMSTISFKSLAALALLVTLPGGNYHPDLIQSYGIKIIKGVENLMTKADRDDMQKISKRELKSLLTSMRILRNRISGYKSSYT